jgi:hypothetical protein
MFKIWWMSDLAVFLNRVSSLLSSEIVWVAGLSVGYAVLLRCNPFRMGLLMYREK